MLTRLLRHRLRTLLALTVLLAAVSSVALAATRTVLVRDNYYTVKTLSVGRGSKVTWRWAGYLRHNVAVKSGPVKFRSRTQVRGTYSHTFLQRGTYRLYCTLHHGMTMTVVVH